MGNEINGKEQCIQADVMRRFLNEFPNGTFEDYLKYYENFINEKFNEYKNKKIKELTKNIR